MVAVAVEAVHEVEGARVVLLNLKYRVAILGHLSTSCQL